AAKWRVGPPPGPPGRERGEERPPPLLPARQLPRPCASERTQAEPFQQRGREPVRRPPEALGVREQRRHADLGRRLGLLGQEGEDARAAREVAERASLERHPARRNGKEAEDRLEERALPGPFGPMTATISPGASP